MEIADFDVNDFNERYAGDRSVYARFYTHPVKDEKASAEAGRSIFNDVEYVEIRAAGNANNIVQRPATRMDKERFQRQYAMFREGMSEQTIGTPLTEVPWLTKSQVEELAYVRVRTLEQLATINDDVCQKMAGLRDLKNRATTMMEAADKAAPITKLEEENAQLRKQMEEMALQMKELTSALKKQKE